jgi:hypothetical protein
MHSVQLNPALTRQSNLRVVKMALPDNNMSAVVLMQGIAAQLIQIIHKMDELDTALTTQQVDFNNLTQAELEARGIQNPTALQELAAKYKQLRDEYKPVCIAVKGSLS